ncbi:MAG: DNA-3-methyladenine glycosylase I [Myxococcales bacterium FL481]|nr:MAG: DNA-3-methyladenine glycosylase I [Myxococcales bacterium FL481]
MPADLVTVPDDTPRCFWGAATPAYRDYHDHEWGRPTADDRWIFEKLCLEGFQSGLSWLTILNKRENFRRAFANFDIEKVARFNQRSVERLLRDEGIVRHRGKITSTMNNAKRARELRDEFGSLAAFVWQFEPGASERPTRITRAVLNKLSKTPASMALSGELKRRGWSFVGPTTMYAFMQAAGLVNDHLHGCAARRACERDRAGFRVPTPRHARATRATVTP